MKILKENILPVLAIFIAVLLCITPTGLSHCEIPCGIYNDAMRLDVIAEDITTIEKSMKEINELSKAGEKNYNQLVRWIMNKEHHSDSLCDMVTQYFMKQRIAPQGIQVRNPAFDVTPAANISAIITEKGVFTPPFNFESIHRRG